MGLTINQNDTTNNPKALNIVNTGGGTALNIDIDANSGVGVAAITFNIVNSGVGVAYAFDFTSGGEEIVSSAVGGTQNKKIRINVASVEYFIPLHTA